VSRRSNSGAAGERVLLKVLGFSVALALVFALVANTLPQVEGEAPADEQLDLGALSMDDFVALGESIFTGKGTCTLCHNERGRGPDLLAFDAVKMALARLEDPVYQGSASDAEGYLRESMRDPGAYVVKGFGTKGSNDTESPMPVVPKPPISLSDVEMDAVIAFLQAKDGNQVTVAIPAEAPAAESSAEPATQAPRAQSPEEAVASYACAACHSILGSESPVGPNLNSVGARLDAERIRESIIAPDAVIAEGFPPGVMPKDFADRMSIRELEMLVRFLAEQKG